MITLPRFLATPPTTTGFPGGLRYPWPDIPKLMIPHLGAVQPLDEAPGPHTQLFRGAQLPPPMFSVCCNFLAHSNSGVHFKALVYQLK